ncbi:DoxX family protein [Streptomyces sp. CA-294286]|uniref:DoxX family protein n=1 Tax=Streptomyces sp. CA-294286 TaxID=3240070 RepID=UPI003D8B63D8
MTPDDDRSARLLVGLLAGAGAAHVAVPRLFDGMVPEFLPGRQRTWTHASGVVELLLAAAVAVPQTRKAGGLAAAGYFAAILPAHLKMAHDWREKPAALRAGAYARIPLQVPLVLWAVKVARNAAR